MFAEAHDLGNWQDDSLDVDAGTGAQRCVTHGLVVEQQIGGVVALDDPLMQLGLTSVKATKLVTLVQAQLGSRVQLEVFAVFNYPTVRQLATYLFRIMDLELSSWNHPIMHNVEQFRKSLTDRELNHNEPLNTVTAQSLDQAPRLEPQAASMEPQTLASPQEQFWLLYELDSSIKYNVPIQFKLEGCLDSRALVGAVKLLTSKHTVLTVKICHVIAQTKQMVQPSSISSHL